MMARTGKHADMSSIQGLTLVHFSAEPEPLLTRSHPNPLIAQTPAEQPQNSPE
jgi:hypothetical protein